MIEEVIILAAGYGGRLGLSTPKCLVEINGKTLLDYQLESLRDIPQITLVTGFMSSLIRERVFSHHQSIQNKIKFINNDKYESTSNVHSLSLVYPKIRKPTIIMMADLLIPKASYAKFFSKCVSESTLIAITEAKSKDAIYVDKNHKNEVTEISRDIKTSNEWVGMLFVRDLIIDKSKKSVFELIRPYLPTLYCEINCWEIDTFSDLESTKKSYRKE